MKRSELIKFLNDIQLVQLTAMVEDGYYDFYLNKRSKDIVLHFLKKTKGYDELARRYHISKERVRQIGSITGLTLMRCYMRKEDEFTSLLKDDVHDPETQKKLEQVARTSVFGKHTPGHLLQAEKKMQIDRRLQKLDLDTRTLNSLYNHGIVTLDHLLKMNINELKRVRNISEKTASRIIEALSENGYHLKEAN